MIISCRGLVVASSLLLLGGRVRAQPTDIGGKMEIQSSTSTSGSTSSIASATLPVPRPANTESNNLPSPITNANPTIQTDADPPRTPALNAPFGTHWLLPSRVTFNQEAPFGFVLFQVNQFPALNSEMDASGGKSSFALVLAQTSALDEEIVSPENTHWITQLFSCHQGFCLNEGFTVYPNNGEAVSWNMSSYTFQRTGKDSTDNNNFFLCFGARTGNGFACQDWSSFFTIHEEEKKGADLQPTENNAGLGNPPIMQTGQIISLDVEPTISYKGILPQALPTGMSITPSTTWAVTITTSPTSTNVGSPAISRPGGSSGTLSTRAIVGIVLGSLVLVSLLAALALFFYIRRRRRAQSAGTTHEQAMLTHSHPENNSQDRLAEKDNAVHTLIHPNSNDSSFLFPDQNDTSSRQTLIPIGTAYGGSGDNANSGFHDTESREIHTSPYDHAVTTPSSTTPIFAASSSPPRRKPTNASTTSAGGISALSRNISSATTASADSYNDYPVHAQLQNIGEENNSSANMESQARYGDTPRHLPQVFDRGTSASPFLSEPGMSAEEMERLDEEERRIDAAIAAADEQRERDRGGSGMR